MQHNVPNKDAVLRSECDIDKQQKDLNKSGEWALENEMKINP
jgi:hypothetical protein